MSDTERRLAAIMFTDVVGFTSLSQRNEALALELLEEHRRLLRPIIAGHHGAEVKTMGDAFLVEFASALEAVRCAFEIQQSMHEMNSSRTPEKRVVLRIGVHVGDVVRSRGDVYGDAVNVASRIEPLAEPGGICISQQVYDQVQNKFEFPFVALGSKQLKNVDVPVEAFRVVLPWEKGEPRQDVGLDKHRLAVLPFSNISADPNDEYFADGMTEELISTTSAISGLTVIARTSVMRYKGGNKGVSEIGRELNVGSLLEGSVRKAGDRLRITVQLIDAQSEGHLWAQSYDRQMEDIFSVQSEIAQRVADALQLKLMENEMRHMQGRSTGSMDAYNFYLKGRYFWNERTKEGLTKAIGYFERAIEKDPNYALAYVGLSDSYGILASYGYVSTADALPKAKDNALKALELDDALAEAHASLAMVMSNEWDLKGAGRELRTAIRLNPSYASAHQWYADYLMYVEQKAAEAISEKLRARELDPFSPMTNLNVGGIYYAQRQYDKALTELKKALEIFPDFWNLHMFLAYTLMMTGRFEESLAEVRKAASLSADEVQVNMSLGVVHAVAGKKEEAMKAIDKLIELSKSRYVPPFTFAFVYAALDDRDEAFRWLDRAYEERVANLPGALLEDPLFVDRLGSDPRWDALLQKVGLR